MGLNAALGIAGRALEVFAAGIQVAGQNVANASTPGYIREELRLHPDQPYQQGGMVLGTGVAVSGVVQNIDRFLEVRIHSANSDYTASAARQSIYTELESQIRELGDQDLSTALSNFLATVQNLANQPESQALAQQVVQQGTQLANGISSLRVRLDEQRQAQVVKVDQLTDEANGLIKQIADLNPKISKLEAGGLLGSEAGALRSVRYTALNRLSEIVPIRFQERSDGGVDVFSGSDYLILTGQYQQFETVSTGDRNVAIQNVRLSITGSEISATVGGGGELRGVLEGRDNVVGGFVDDLDKLTANLIFEFNKIHASGEGQQGFSTVTADARVSDPTVALNNAGLAFTPQDGSFQVKVTNKLTGLTTTSTINVDLDGFGTDTSLNSLAADLGAVNNVSAAITGDGRLKLDADPNYEIRFSNDSSYSLAALGINTFFTGSNSGDVGVNSVLQSNSALFAGGQGGGPSDGRNALALSKFADRPVASLNGKSLNAFYDSIVGDVAKKSSAETTVAAGLKDFRDSLQTQRQQFSGVSIDEEAIKIMEFQRAFQASARIVTTVDELFKTLLNI